MSQAAGKRRTRVPVLPAGFVYDLPSLARPQNSATNGTPSLDPSPSHEVHTTPCVETTAPGSSTSAPGNSPSLHLLNLQIEKQQLELRLLELEAQSRARELVSSRPAANKPRNIPSLETVRGGVNSVSPKVNSTTIHASLTPKNGLVFTFLSVCPERSLRIYRRQNSCMAISISCLLSLPLSKRS